jgi:tetratricopeptide (TPR) repeat protein
MAKLFLSYSRKDEVKARRFTEWLERSGHDVWRDEDDIGGGASFSQEIETALKDSDAVLVLWSADSVRSAWVRDEAGYGRDAGKLIPFSLDGTEPPLGFRQFQSINLSRWKGHRDPQEKERIRQAIARVAGAPHVEPAPHRPDRRGWRDEVSGKLLLVGGVVAVVALVFALVFGWERWSTNQQIAIAVLPSPKSSDRAMAMDFANVAAADMAAYLPRRFDRATVIAPADADQAAGYRMLISTDPHGPALNASLTLSDLDGRTTLWSQNWSVADASGSDLKQDISAAASKAALCLTDARGGRDRLSQPALSLYLSGCTGLGDTKLSNTDFETIFERVTKLAPNFGPGWGYLALSQSWKAAALRNGPPAAYDLAVNRTRATIAIARKLSPDSTRSYDAEYHLISNDPIAALRVLDKAAAVDPDDGLIQMHRSEQLLSVGRISDAVDAAQRSIELDPGASFARSHFIQSLIFSGQYLKAKAALADARKKWPNDPFIDFAEFSLDSRSGDFRAALEVLPKVEDNDADIDVARKVFAARMDRTPAKIDAAIAALSANSPNDPGANNGLLGALADFGRTDEAYKLMEDPKFAPAINSSLLFRPGFEAIRADQRFMAVAARLGLVRYWRQTGNWPDFCSAEKLAYDCKAEAAKFH